MTQTADNVALLPAYLAAGTAVLVLLTDLLAGRRGATLAAFTVGTIATAVAAVVVGAGGDRRTFCVADACSYLATGRSALVATGFALLTLGVLALSVPMLRAGEVPTGEYAFLLAASMTGGVVLGAAGDLITLIVALETLTLPLYVLVGLRRRSVAGAEAAVTFFVVSVVATAVTLLGAALLYAVTGTVHLRTLAAAFAAGPGLLEVPLTGAAVALVVLGLGFKVAAVPFHAWAPATYAGAPVPVAAYLSTASKLGGVVALLAVVGGVPIVDAGPALDGGATAAGAAPTASTGALPAEVTGSLLAALAVLTMTVGNLVALRQTDMIRLLAWSSVAQAGYILAPLGALALTVGRGPDALATAVAAAVTYTVFFVVLEFAAFAAVVALRPPGVDGGPIEAYRGAARQRPWVGAAFVLALVGLAGLPPGLAGLFAKVAVVRSLLETGSGWLALAVAVNAVIGLAYYVRVAATLYAPAEHRAQPRRTPGVPVLALPVAGALAAATAVAVVIGFAPQFILDAARF